MTTHRIWVISRQYFPTPTGAAIQTHRLLSQIMRHGFDATVLTVPQRESAFLRGSQCDYEGVQVVYLAASPRKDWSTFLGVRLPRLLYKVLNHLNFIFTKLSFGLLCGWHLAQQGRQDDIVLFISSDPFWFIPAGVARLRGIPLVLRMTMLGGDDPSTLEQRIAHGRLLYVGNLLTYYLVDRVIALSTALADDYRQSHQDSAKLCQIPVGVDTEIFHPIAPLDRAGLRRSLGLSADRRYILFVGFAMPRKGIDILLRAFIHVAEIAKDVDLLLAGQYIFDQPGDPVEYTQMLTQLRAELDMAGFTDRVHWLGHIDNVQQYFQAADIFCFPSRQEGLPNAVAEALASGLPVVANHLLGVTTDLIEHEVNGFLIDNELPEAYAAILLRLLNDSTLARRVSAAARARIENDFCLEDVAARYVDLFNEQFEDRRRIM